MNPRCAWIDCCHGEHVLFAIFLREKGIELAVAGTLDKFLQEYDLNDYPVLFYHPGITQQHRINEVIQRFPNTRVALIIAPGSGGDYAPFLGLDIPGYTYDVDSAEKFIRDNQR